MKTIKMAILIAVVLMLFVPSVFACVGKTLTIGVTNSTEGKVFAEMLSTLVNERTGTTINIKYFDNSQDIYEAVKKQDVDISIENTTSALNVLNMPKEADIKKAYKIVKSTYEKEKGLIWLKPFGFTKAGSGEAPAYTATILRMDILNNFPALPRLFNKLGSKINDAAYVKLIKSVESGEEVKKVARNFLKSKKLI